MDKDRVCDPFRRSGLLSTSLLPTHHSGAPNGLTASSLAHAATPSNGPRFLQSLPQTRLSAVAAWYLSGRESPRSKREEEVDDYSSGRTG